MGINLEGNDIYLPRALKARIKVSCFSCLWSYASPLQVLTSFYSVFLAVFMAHVRAYRETAGQHNYRRSLIFNFLFCGWPREFLQIMQREDFNLGDTTRWRISGHERRSFSNKSVPILFKCFSYFIYKPYCLFFFLTVIERYLFYVLFSVLGGSRSCSSNFLLRSFLNITVQVVWRSVF